MGINTVDIQLKPLREIDIQTVNVIFNYFNHWVRVGGGAGDGEQFAGNNLYNLRHCTWFITATMLRLLS